MVVRSSLGSGVNWGRPVQRHQASSCWSGPSPGSYHTALLSDAAARPLPTVYAEPRQCVSLSGSGIETLLEQPELLHRGGFISGRAWGGSRFRLTLSQITGEHWRFPPVILDRVVRVITNELKDPRRNPMGVVESLQGLSAALTRDRDRCLQTRWSIDEAAKRTESPGNLAQVSIKTDDDCHVTPPCEHELYDVESNDQVNALFLRPLPGGERNLTRLALGMSGRQRLPMPPVPVIAERSNDGEDPCLFHSPQPSIEVADFLSLFTHVRVGAASVETHIRSMSDPRPCQPLREKVRMTQRVAKDTAARLIKVLSVNEDANPCRGARGERMCPAHARSHARKPRSTPLRGKPGPVKTCQISIMVIGVEGKN